MFIYDLITGEETGINRNKEMIDWGAKIECSQFGKCYMLAIECKPENFVTPFVCWYTGEN